MILPNTTAKKIVKRVKNQHAKFYGQFWEKTTPVKLVSDARLIAANLRTVNCYLIYPTWLRHNQAVLCCRRVRKFHSATCIRAISIRLHFTSARLQSTFFTPAISWISSIRINTKEPNILLSLYSWSRAKPSWSCTCLQKRRGINEVEAPRIFWQ